MPNGIVNKEEYYKKYKINGWLDNKEFYGQQHPEYDKNSTIISDFKSRFQINENEFDSFTETYSDIPYIISKCTTERLNGFGSKENFYNWYSCQEKKCFYCGTEENDLKNLFSRHFAPKKNAWKNGSLQIERQNPQGGYNEDNCVLACVHCNNAKSDIISKEDWVSFFAEPMSKFLQSKLETLK